jgi:hypothetical protein
MRRTLAIVVAAAFLVTGCSWVKTTPGGEQVREATAAEVSGCQDVGVAVASTQAKAAGIPRDKDVIRDEQVTLARNRAAQIGGDTIVPNGPSSEGKQSFIVYKCR